MTRPRFHILRSLRTQMRTGYLREMPVALQVMKDLPNLARPDTMVRRMNPLTVPYSGLYRKIFDRNPLAEYDGVNYAFAHQDTTALALAKHQFAAMKAGLSEEEAYRKAVDHFSNEENNAYVDLKKAVEEATKQGSVRSFATNPETLEELKKWQAKAEETPYSKMELHEQGELEYFLQVKVLMWNETERVRRMKDNAFVLQFEKLLAELFPMSEQVKQAKIKESAMRIKNKTFSFHNLDPAHMTTNRSFFVEDYLSFFEKLKAKPDLRHWEVADRQQLSRWIIDCVAFGSAMIGRTPTATKAYLDQLRDSFFPMIRLPFLAESMTVPSVEDVKLALYENEVGYKTMSKKTFVKRSYRIPALLFPDKVFVAQVMEDKDRFASLSDNDELLQQAMDEAGLQNFKLDDIRNMLVLAQHAIASRSSADDRLAVDDESGATSSVLDQILGDTENLFNASSALDRSASSSSATPDDDEISESESEPDHEASSFSLYDGDDAVFHGTPEWEAMIEKHYRLPKTAWEEDKAALFSVYEPYSVEDIRTEKEAEAFNEHRYALFPYLLPFSSMHRLLPRPHILGTLFLTNHAAATIEQNPIGAADQSRAAEEV